MKFSAFAFSFLVILMNLEGLEWRSTLSETPETYAIVELLKVYETYDGSGPISLRRIGKEYDGGYVIPELAMREAEVVIGYGIGSDISFEDAATQIYGKPSYGFDCTTTSIHPSQKNCHFIPSCIVSKEMMKYTMRKNGRLASFDDHIIWTNSAGKKLFLKMDIEGNEYKVMPDILEHAANITGIVLEIHFSEENQIDQALHLLKMLEKDFLLVHLHGNNCCKDSFVTSNSKGHIPRIIEVTYINRGLVQDFRLSPRQSHPTHLDMSNGCGLDAFFTILTPTTY